MSKPEIKAKGKKSRPVLSKEERAEKAKKYDSVNENYRTINTSEIGGKVKVTVTTQACHVRGKGVLVREVSSTGSVSSVFLPGMKIKKKKAWNTIVEDKGPKPKKERKAKK